MFFSKLSNRRRPPINAILRKTTTTTTRSTTTTATSPTTTTTKATSTFTPCKYFWCKRPWYHRYIYFLSANIQSKDSYYLLKIIHKLYIFNYYLIFQSLKKSLMKKPLLYLQSLINWKFLMNKIKTKIVQELPILLESPWPNSKCKKVPKKIILAL